VLANQGPHPCWVVTRDKLSNVIDFREVAADTDLRATLTAERARYVAGAWTADDIGRYTSFFVRARASAPRAVVSPARCPMIVLPAC
jgi:hypothetical protein